jgi:hypothetical protein
LDVDQAHVSLTTREIYNMIPGGSGRFATFGNREMQIARIFQDYTQNYERGIQTPLGPQLDDWLRRAAIPGSSTASLANEFQQTFQLSAEFMQRVNLGLQMPLEGFTSLGPDFFTLPRYGGIAHFWGDLDHSSIRARINRMFSSDRGQTWFRVPCTCSLLKSLVLRQL